MTCERLLDGMVCCHRARASSVGPGSTQSRPVKGHGRIKCCVIVWFRLVSFCSVPLSLCRSATSGSRGCGIMPPYLDRKRQERSNVCCSYCMVQPVIKYQVSVTKVP